MFVAESSVHQLVKGQIAVYSYYGIHLSCKKEKILMHITKWMNLKNILDEKGQTQKSINCRIPLI